MNFAANPKRPMNQAEADWRDSWKNQAWFRENPVWLRREGCNHTRRGKPVKGFGAQKRLHPDRRKGLGGTKIMAVRNDHKKKTTSAQRRGLKNSSPLGEKVNEWRQAARNKDILRKQEVLKKKNYKKKRA